MTDLDASFEAAATTSTPNRPRVDSERGMMILLFVIVVVSVISVMLVGG
jgi:hypothetical protein